MHFIYQKGGIFNRSEYTGTPQNPKKPMLVEIIFFSRKRQNIYKIIERYTTTAILTSTLLQRRQAAPVQSVVSRYLPYNSKTAVASQSLWTAWTLQASKQTNKQASSKYGSLSEQRTLRISELSSSEQTEERNDERCFR